MNADRLLALYERVAEAANAVPRLRRFVLDLAVRGKLVTQEPGDEPASELLKRIAAEKVRLVKAGTLKPERTPKEPVSSVESFKLPRGWTWTNLQAICISISDGDHQPPPKSETGVPFLVIGDVKTKTINYDAERRVPQEYFDSLDPIRKPRSGDLLYTLVGSFGIPVAVRSDEPFCIQRHIGILRPAKHVEVQALAFFLESEFAFKQAEAAATGIAQKTVSLAGLRSMKLPLPPLAEQRRIVAKVEELMALLDRLEATRTAREATRDRLTAASLARLSAPDATAEDFPNHAHFTLATLPALTARFDQIKSLRQTILNLAVQGKLVEQDQADEPASELLKRLQYKKSKHGKGRNWSKGEAPSSELAFEAPRGWAWTTIDQTALRVTVGHVGPMKDKYVNDGVPFLRSQNVRANAFRPDGLTFISQEFHHKIIKSALAPGDVVVVRSGNVGTACVIPPELPVANCSDLVLIQSPEAVVPEYLCFYLNSLASVHVEAGAVGVALTHFNTKSVATMPFPIPPLAEQHRIVAKVDALMALCDRLEAALTTADTTRARLLEALLHEALLPVMPRMAAAE